MFILAGPEARDERAALQAAGFTIRGTVATHAGGGTASVGLLFANAYLELLWVDPSVTVDPSRAQAWETVRRRAAWRSTGASPFGVGLRRAPGASDELPVGVTRYSAPWMRPGTAIETVSDVPAAPALFVVPRDIALDAWVQELRQREPEAFRHAAGVERLTRVVVAGPIRLAPSATALLRDVPGLQVREEPKHRLELTFDDGRRNKQADLRPRLPVVVNF